MKRHTLILMVVLALVVGAAAGCATRPVPVTPNELRVITTLFPQYDFVRQIAGDRVQVSLMLPPGMEPHAFEPSQIGRAHV